MFEQFGFIRISGKKQQAAENFQIYISWEGENLKFCVVVASGDVMGPFRELSAPMKSSRLGHPKPKTNTIVALFQSLYRLFYMYPFFSSWVRGCKKNSETCWVRNLKGSQCVDIVHWVWTVDTMPTTKTLCPGDFQSTISVFQGAHCECAGGATWWPNLQLMLMASQCSALLYAIFLHWSQYPVIQLLCI